MMRTMVRGHPGAGGPAETLYGVLGVPPEATRESIVQAYRRQARCVHPDARPDDISATERFRSLADAYHVLGDPARRAAYDRSLGQKLREEGPRRTSPGREVGRMDPAVFLGMMAPSPRGASLWAAPVRVEGSPSVRSGEPLDPLVHRYRQLLGSSSVVRLLLEGWSK
jgi:curved DNA-binding protein CbpA